ncbi:hypothetical protein TNCV_2396431 [Trichonephila clavipes]|uniref:Uncharacterized protein n=1 Tax=Trichonephila clavipes TaxID=2585209 RepID=A0A8X6VR52_TRICX|nr:hypothetical protein TNCV_2396431 [Trichonephila clavipes]
MKQSTNCVPCELSYWSQAALRRHNEKCHGKVGALPSKKNNVTQNKPRQWCTHCTQYVMAEDGIAAHIRVAHNDTVQVDATRPASTRMVKVDPKNVTDTSIPHGTATITIEEKRPQGTKERLRCVYCEKTFFLQSGLLRHTHGVAP